MELSKSDTKILKGIGILLMVILHLFARKDVDGLYITLPTLNDVPLVYYLGIMGDACRPIYLFVTGYAFFITLNQNNNILLSFKKNIKRILKLLTNLWIVLLIFFPLGLLFGDKQIFTLESQKFLLNFLGLTNSYNGAWWFVQIYIILVLLSPLLIKLVNSNNPLLLFFISGGIYFITHVQRYKNLIDFGDDPFVVKLVTLVVLLGTSQFSFFIGAIFSKEKIYSKIHTRFNNIKFKNTLLVSTLCLLIFVHSIIESAIIGPINAIFFICIYLLMNKHIFVEKILDFVSNHSTNIWLIHMFFYSTIFEKLVFAPKIPILVFVWLIVLCIFTSYIIKFLLNPIHKFIDKWFITTVEKANYNTQSTI